MSKRASFFDELKRRNVIRAVGLYLVGAWLLIQVASTILPAFDVQAIHVLARDTDRAPEEVEKARTVLEARLHERPDNGGAMADLSWVYLALKRNDEALQLAHRAAALLPLEKDALDGSYALRGSAEVQARVGQTAKAVKTLRRLLSVPAGLSVSIQRLKIDAVWDPIRNDPGFQQLLTGTDHVGP